MVLKMKQKLRYFLGFWHHEFGGEEPDWILSEFDENGDVLRQISRFQHGKFFLESVEPGARSVVEQKFVPEEFEEIFSETSFFYLDGQQFERYWEIGQEHIGRHERTS